MAFDHLSERLRYHSAVFHGAAVGARAPEALLAEIVRGQVAVLDTNDLFRNGRAVILGVPGAFTPLASQQCVPELVRNADALHASGYHTLVCVAPESPWVVRKWADELDPKGRIRFLSDGNLAWTSALGLLTRDADGFLGECPKRYLLSLHDGVIEHLRVDSHSAPVVRASGDVFMLDG